MRKIIPYAVSLGLVGFLFYNSIDIIKVSGDSMEPLLSNGQVMMGVRTNYYKKGNIVVAQIPDEKDSTKAIAIVKRIYGVPGDKVQIQEGEVWINNELTKMLNIKVPDGHFTLRKDEYFLLGDSPSTIWVRAKVGAIRSRMEVIQK